MSSPLAPALAVLGAAVDELIRAAEGGTAESLDPVELVQLWQQFEQIRNRLGLVDHALIAAAQTTDLADHHAFSSLGMFLTRMLRLSPGAAAQRIRVAAAVGARTSMLGERLEPEMPILAAAQRTGALSDEQVGIVERAVTQLRRPDLGPEGAETVEQLLTGYAATFGPKDLRLLARRAVDATDPDGREPDDQVVQDRRELRLKQLRDGMWRIEGRLTPTTGTQLNAILSPLAKPRITRIEIDGTVKEAPDPRHYGQRTHDALDEACSRLLKSGNLPATGGTPAAVIVTIAIDDLVERTGSAETTDGTLLNADQLLRIAGEAEIWPMISTTSGVPLALGRTRRIATHAQTVALVARDGGCSFPGCTHPPAWCDRHHIKEWIHGGPTDLDNLTLLCRYHHTHFAQKGWAVVINIDGLPEWIPPKWVDREQRPQMNNRIRRRLGQHGHRPRPLRSATTSSSGVSISTSGTR